jgi:hypothetical protein
MNFSEAKYPERLQRGKLVLACTLNKDNRIKETPIIA